MLVLSRKVREKLMIGSEIEITVTRIAGNRVQIGIEAPEHINVLRGELCGQETERQAAVNDDLPPSEAA